MMKRTFSKRFMDANGEDGIQKWKDEVAQDIGSAVREGNRIVSYYKNVTVFLEKDE